jgi:hypothetical protein
MVRGAEDLPRLTQERGRLVEAWTALPICFDAARLLA